MLRLMFPACRMAGRIAGLVFLVCMTSTQADVTPFNGYVALQSNYIGRGLAQSVGQPSLQAELNYAPEEGLYTGVSGASINWIDQLFPGSSVSLEVDAWLGWRENFAQHWVFKSGILRLQFPGKYAPGVAPAHTTEMFASLAWRSMSAKLNYAVTDAFGTPDSRGSWYLDVSASLPLSESWSAGAHIGRKQAHGTNPDNGIPHDRASYTDYRLSLTRSFTRGMSVDLAYSWTNAEPSLYTLDDYNVAGKHLRLSLQKDF